MLTGQDKQLYEISEQFSYVKTFIVAVRGFEKKDLKKLNQIKTKLLENKLIISSNQLNNKSYQDYKKEYKFYLNDFNFSDKKNINISTKLKQIYTNIISSPFYTPIDLSDPLNIVKKEQIKTTIKFKNDNPILQNYGYFAVFSILSKTDEKSRLKIYNQIHTILDNYEDIKAFSTIFMFVENSQKIQNDVRMIIMISMGVLGVLYLLILRNLYLFLNIAMTLGTSVILGQIVVTYIFPQTSVIALVFSTAITSVSIDYMFHHYLHNYYNKKLGFNRSVFYGFLTTIIAFFLISMINFPLIEQISIFTMISLTVAYIHFAFVYPLLGIKHKEPKSLEKFKAPIAIKGYKIIIFSIFIILLSLYNVKFDFNIKNLDYKNTKLLATQKFFQDNLNKNKKVPVFITGATIDTLISNSQMIRNLDPNAIVPLSSLLSQKQYIQKTNNIHNLNFSNIKKQLNSISKDLGFKQDYFNNSYSSTSLYPAYPNYSVDMITNMGFDIVKNNNIYLSYGMISPTILNKVLKYDFIKNAQTKILFENSLKKVSNDLMLFGALTIIFIISILAMVTKKRFLQAFTYILFPAALILLYGWFVPLNIMHLFMAFVILAVGIDYGIYMNEPKLTHNTTLAIVFSLISTFAGFGVLAISNINSLYSIGMTAIIGIIGILFLLIFQKRIKKH
jgi:MFS family permease